MKDWNELTPEERKSIEAAIKEVAKIIDVHILTPFNKVVIELGEFLSNVEKEMDS